MNYRYYVYFGNAKNWFRWREEYKNYTSAWIAYQTAMELRSPKRVALNFVVE